MSFVWKADGTRGAISLAASVYTLAHCFISPELYAGAPTDIAWDIRCFALSRLALVVVDMFVVEARRQMNVNGD